jgi:hypothetical protein
MRFEVVICRSMAEVPNWCRGPALEVAAIAEGENEMPVVAARRSDGAVQVVPTTDHDPHVMAQLLCWAAGADDADEPRAWRWAE